MLREYLDVDVVLDTFPYNGGVTTLESLWMGRPVVSLAGDTLIGRQSKAMLAAIGLDGRLCARDSAGFAEIAAALVADPEALAELSASLRGKVSRSRLVDTVAFTSDLETLLRSEWRRWCRAQAPA
jgi:predicted O-linked N-acetylglucosamine transferase (SPINDLY family)